MSNGTITMTGAEYDAIAAKVAALEAKLREAHNDASYYAARNEELREELAKLRAGQEPVDYKDDPRSPSELSLAGCNCVRFGENNPHWPCRIHTAPQPSAVPDGWRPVPITSLERMSRLIPLPSGMFTKI